MPNNLFFVKLLYEVLSKLSMLNQTEQTGTFLLNLIYFIKKYNNSHF